MERMVISFLPDGKVQHLLNDSFFKIEGHRTIDRVSEIRFDDETQCFYIRWLQGPYTGKQHTRAMADKYAVSCEYAGYICVDEFHEGNDILIFASYEDAVEHEVDMVNAMRLLGVVF